MDDHRHGLSQALIRLAHTRDPGAWTLLVERCQPTVERLARRLAGNSGLAADAVQEAWLQIRDHAGRFLPRGDDPDAGAWGWIMRVTANATLQMCRRQRTHVRMGPHTDALIGPGGDALERDETALALRIALAELPESTSTAIVLHHVEGLPFAEIAAALGCAPGTAKVRAHRGLEQLRSRLAGRGLALSALAIASVLRDLPAAEGVVGTAAPALLHATAAPALGAAPAVGGALASTIALAVTGSILLIGTAALALHIGNRSPPFTSAAPEPVQTVAAAPSHPPALTPDVLLALDFENGLRPAPLRDGDIVAGPPRDGNRFCVAGLPKPHGDLFKKEVWFEPPQVRLFIYEKGLVLRFDCWFTGTADALPICLNETTRGGTYQMGTSSLEPGRWVHIDMPLDDFGLESDPAQRLMPGDQVRNLLIGAFGAPGNALYIDNVAIIRPPPPP